MADLSVAKKLAAEHATSFIKDGMTVGLGTGSTAKFAIEKIGSLVKQGLKVECVPTSIESEVLAKELEIPLLESFTRIDVTIDGADEVDVNGNLIKGGGGALTREKIVAAATQKLIIVIDPSKYVEILGKFPLPIEVLHFGSDFALATVKEMGCEAKFRERDGSRFSTNNGNLIIDCDFKQISDPETLTVELNLIPGVVENGLFVGMCDLVITGREGGKIEEVEISNYKGIH